MKFTRKSSSDITLENGKSKIKLLPITIMPDPNNVGRVARIYVVKQVLYDSAKNPIRRGQELALSFPPEKINAKEYTWHREQGEPCQISMRTQRGI